MDYLILAYNRYYDDDYFQWSYIKGYWNNRAEGLVMCGYGDISEAQRFHERKDVRIAANKLLTRKVETYMRTIAKVIIQKDP